MTIVCHVPCVHARCDVLLRASSRAGLGSGSPREVKGVGEERTNNGVEAVVIGCVHWRWSMINGAAA